MTTNMLLKKHSFQDSLGELIPECQAVLDFAMSRDDVMWWR